MMTKHASAGQGYVALKAKLAADIEAMAVEKIAMITLPLEKIGG